MEKVYFLGIDIGTQESKGVIMDSDGVIMGTHVCKHQLLTPKPGRFEHDAETEWWGDFCTISKALFEKTGINFCLTADGASDTVWLPSDIGIAMRYGLSFQTALESVTIRPARLLGLENRVGSLEVGKDADIAIFDGMPFENLTSCVATIIDGKIEHCAL